MRLVVDQTEGRGEPQRDEFDVTRIPELVGGSMLTPMA